MSNILDDIVAQRKNAVRDLKAIVPVRIWEEMPLFGREGRSLEKNLHNEEMTGIIAEFKRASPSKGMINDKAVLEKVLHTYEMEGASGISILTEPLFFKGSNDDILNAAMFLNTPVLRKDFIIDEYQVIESKAIGADVILLIAACLQPREVKRLALLAKQTGLEVILEIHHEKELDHICDEVDMVGINNRDLKTFEVSIDTSLKLINKIPTGRPAIAESGIKDAETIVTLKHAGFKGFLIGEMFMKQADPAIAFAAFVEKLNARADE